jgi:Ankyrin repeats (3 copies)
MNYLEHSRRDCHELEIDLGCIDELAAKGVVDDLERRQLRASRLARFGESFGSAMHTASRLIRPEAATQSRHILTPVEVVPITRANKTAKTSPTSSPSSSSSWSTSSCSSTSPRGGQRPLESVLYDAKKGQDTSNDSSGTSVPHAAISDDNHPIRERLLEAARVGNLDILADGSAREADEFSRLLGPLLFTACEYGHIHIVNWFLCSSHEVNVNYQNGDGVSCLLTAVYGNHIDVVRSLLLAGARIDIEDKFGALPVSAACENNNFEMVDVLKASLIKGRPTLPG